MGRISPSESVENKELNRLKQLLLPLLQEASDYGDYTDGYSDPDPIQTLGSSLDINRDPISSLLQQAEYLSNKDYTNTRYRDAPNHGSSQSNLDPGYFWKSNPKVSDPGLSDPVGDQDRTYNLPKLNLQAPFYQQPKDRYFADLGITNANNKALYDEITRIMHELAESDKRLKNSRMNLSNRVQKTEKSFAVQDGGTNKQEQAVQAQDPIQDVDQYKTENPPGQSAEAQQPTAQSQSPEQPTRKQKKKKKRRRHVGQHDGEGLQRLISTGKCKHDRFTP